MAKYRCKVTNDNMEEVFKRIIEFLQHPTKYREPSKGDDSNDGNEISLIAPKIRYDFYDENPKIIITDLLLGRHIIEITGHGDTIVEIDATRRICIYNMCDHMVGYKTKIIDEHEAYMSHSFRRVSKITNYDISREISRLICGIFSKYLGENLTISQMVEETAGTDSPEVLKFEIYALEEIIHAVNNAHWIFRDDVNRPAHFSLIKYHLPGDGYVLFNYKPYIKHLSEDAPKHGYDISETITFHYDDNVNHIMSDNIGRFLFELQKAFGSMSSSEGKP